MSKNRSGIQNPGSLNLFLLAEIIRVLGQTNVLLETLNDSVVDKDKEMFDRTKKMISDLMPKLSS